VGVCGQQLLEIIVLIVLLPMQELPLQVTVGEFLLEFVEVVFVIVFFSIHLDLYVSKLVV
jgi:hypothetical protein